MTIVKAITNRVPQIISYVGGVASGVVTVFTAIASSRRSSAGTRASAPARGGAAYPSAGGGRRWSAVENLNASMSDLLGTIVKAITNRVPQIISYVGGVASGVVTVFTAIPERRDANRIAENHRADEIAIQLLDNQDQNQENQRLPRIEEEQNHRAGYRADERAEHGDDVHDAD